MKIEIWSDIACPFCYIGRARLMKAIESIELGHAVELLWKSFILDPSLSANVEYDIYTMLSQKKGMSSTAVAEMVAGVREMAEGEGLCMDFDKVKPVSTFAAHRLLQRAKEKGLGDAMKLRLFEAYFCEGANVAEPTELTLLAQSVGLADVDVQASQSEEKYASAVNRDITEAQAYRVSGVPFFVINGKYGISGAQPQSVFEETLNKIGEEKRPDIAK